MLNGYGRALIVGVGEGLSASLARALAAGGLRVGLAARNISKLEALAAETNGAVHGCDASCPAEVAALFTAMDEKLGGAPDVVIYNPSARVRGPIVELDPEAVRRALEVTAFGALLVAQQAARRMVPAGRGAILLTGASAGVKGFARSAPFAMGKFALRGLAQSLARELGPQGIHVAHIIVDGAIRSESRPDRIEAPDATLNPDDIARTYLTLLAQGRSAWTDEVAVRPWTETF